MSHSRSGMNVDQTASALGKGNQGATAVCLSLGRVDPYYLTLLDELDITGSAIYMLFNDVCGEDLSKTGQMLVACHARVDDLDRDKLMHAINNRGAGVDVDAIMRKLLEIANTNPAVRSMFDRR